MIEMKVHETPAQLNLEPKEISVKAAIQMLDCLDDRDKRNILIPLKEDGVQQTVYCSSNGESGVTAMLDKTKKKRELNWPLVTREIYLEGDDRSETFLIEKSLMDDPEHSELLLLFLYLTDEQLDELIEHYQSLFY